MALIDVNSLSYFYQDGESRRYILNDISYSFERGRFYAIFGESGSGKTTFMAMLSALDKPKSGTVSFEGKDIKRIGLDKYRRNKISIIFQQYNLVPYMTAAENIRLAMSITDNKLPSNHKEVVYNLLDYIGITKDRADRTVNKLSGGEQQRVAIARALSTNVDIILADEPTGNLDDDMENEIVQIFKKLAHENNKCVIVVTHSSQIANEADEVIKLRKGVFEPYSQAEIKKSAETQDFAPQSNEILPPPQS